MYPKKLYKYKKYDKYTRKMLLKGELYLCPANELDDQFDCAVNFSKERWLNMSDEEISKKSIDLVSSYLADSVPKEFLNLLPQMFDRNNVLGLFDNVNPQGITNGENNKAFNIYNENMNMLDNQISKMENNKQFEDGIKKLLNIQNEIGIASLASSKNNQVLWSMYANNYKGYCIEYEIGERTLDLYKVSYKKSKSFDIVDMIIKVILDNFFSNLHLKPKDSSIIEMAKKIPLIKFNEWKFQKEWRFVGKAKEYVYLPIKAIYLGKNISEKHENKLLEIAKKKKYKVYKCYDDYDVLKIKFKRIL